VPCATPRLPNAIWWHRATHIVSETTSGNLTYYTVDHAGYIYYAVAFLS
jgi:hypothetical protein